MTRNRVLAVLLLVALAGAGAWTFDAHRDADRREQAEAQARTTQAVRDLTLPAAFVPVGCTGANATWDRCWQVSSLPDVAIADAVPSFARAGGNELTQDCPGSPSWKGRPVGCSATSDGLVVLATRDVNEQHTGKDDLMADTSTVAVFIPTLGG